MSKFSDFFHHLIADVKGGASKIEADGQALLKKVDSNIGPVGFGLLQVAVVQAEVTGGAWNVKLLAAVTAAAKSFADANLPVVINDMVAAITVIIDDLKQGATTLETATSAQLPGQSANG